MLLWLEIALGPLNTAILTPYFSSREQPIQYFQDANYELKPFVFFSTLLYGIKLAYIHLVLFYDKIKNYQFLISLVSKMHPYVNVAVMAARRAAKIIIRYLDEIDSLKIKEKGLNDFVTWVDENAENAIIETIQKSYPSHAILGEETGNHPGEEYTWIIDPLDGTLNYLHGFPQFAVSIGIQYKQQIEHAVIYDPLSQDLYTATRGRGAQLNGRRIRVSKCEGLASALIGSSFPFQNRSEFIDKHYDIFKHVFLQSADVRRTGSAALNLAYVAAGRLDGFWESGLKPWDIAAGVLLVREAGGFVSDFNGENNFFENGTIIAGTRKVRSDLLEIIKTHG